MVDTVQRALIQKKLADAFCVEVVASHQLDQEAIAGSLEAGCHDVADGDVATYSMAVYKLLRHADALVPVIADEYKIAGLYICDWLRSLAGQPSTTLDPEANADIVEEIRIRREQRDDVKVSHLYRCNKCGERDTIPIEFQSRCVDEGASIAIQCIHCDHRWRG